MKRLASGVTGQEVTAWQQFLRGHGSINVIDTGTFDEETEKGTRYFQQFAGLNPTGEVDDATLAEAVHQGFPVLSDQGDPVDESSPLWPVQPPDVRFLPYQERVRTFGAIPYTAAPTPSNPEAITIGGTWVRDNITSFPCPDFLKGLPGVGARIFCHVKVADQFQALLVAWKSAGLIPLITSWGGDWVPRFVRGSRVNLSNHAWGTAFDLNAPKNALGTQGALKGQPGSVRDLALIATGYGYAWGGWYADRKDPMHFECFRVL